MLAVFKTKSTILLAKHSKWLFFSPSCFRWSFWWMVFPFMSYARSWVLSVISCAIPSGLKFSAVSLGNRQEKGETVPFSQLFWPLLPSVYWWGFVVLVAESCPTLLWPHGLAHQAPWSMGFPRQEYWSGLPFPSPRDLCKQGWNLYPALAGGLFTAEPPGKP